MIRAFIFDYGNVLSIVDMPAFMQSVRPYVIGPLPAEERLARTRELMVRYESGRMTTSEFIPAFLERAGLRMTREEFITCWAGFFIPIPFTRALIRSLRPEYRLGLLSNTNPLHFDHVIEPTDVYPLFEAVTLSYEVGAMKPDARLYHDILQKLDIGAEQCIYIDDLKTNVEAAEALGMHGIHFTDEKTVAQQIHRWLPGLKLPA